MQRLRAEPAGSGAVLAGLEAIVAAAALAEVPGLGERVEVLLARAAPGDPAVAPRRYEAKGLPVDLRERTTAYSALDALRDAVAKSDAAGREDAAAAARHAEQIVRFLGSTFGGGIAGVRVSAGRMIVITVELPGDDPAALTPTSIPAAS